MTFIDIMTVQTEPSSFSLRARLSVGHHAWFVLLYHSCISCSSLASGKVSKRGALKCDLRKTREWEYNGSSSFKWELKY